MVNVAKLLKDCPQGMKLNCTMCGEVELYTVDYSYILPIFVVDSYGCKFNLTKYGERRNIFGCECVLFPSKENRDWSTFVNPYQFRKFKKFSRVAVRNDNEWHIDFFDCYCLVDGEIAYKCLNGTWKECRPYNFLRGNVYPKKH